MKKILLFISTIFLSQVYIHAQLNIGGEPISLYKKDLKTNIPLIILPEQDNNILIAEANANLTKDQPWQFGKNIDVQIDLKKQAVIDKLPNGKLYRLAIESDDATTLNLRFSHYNIPEKATLYIYNSDKSDMIGGFTNANMQTSNTFATSLVNGDHITLEYFEPNNADFSAELIIDRITHGFRSIKDFSKGFGSSGNCNMNVICPDADNWRDEIRSVCMLVTGGSGFCSAALINNTQEDGTPYILTADHCYHNPSDLVFMFNWESETCDNPTLSPAHDDLSGAVLIAGNAVSDFCLFEMNDEPPYDYNVYYAGWDAEDNSSTQSVGIHHPKGDIKKISFDDEASVSDFYLANQGVEDSHWKVIWDRETTTESGSSGSPLFNENRQIIGQLHGGYASCFDLNEPDWYGKLSFSWDYGTSPDTRLKEWLDPSTSEIKSFPGFDPNAPVADYDAHLLKINSPDNFHYGENTIIPSFKFRNRGNLPLTSLSLKYEINDDLPVSKQWTGNLNTGEITDIVFDAISLESGKYSLLVYLESPNGTEDEYKYNDTLRKDFYIYETIFEDDFESDRSWYLTGEFEIDKPIGKGGEIANPDPTFAFSDEYILGTDLTGLGQHPGDYENSIIYAEFAQSPLIDCRNFENTLLTFQRWLGTDKGLDDGASIRIYNDSVWTTIWDNQSGIITDSEWKEQIFDISELADGHKIMIQFLTGPTDHAEQYCGWNIDDFMVSGIRNKEQITEEEHIKLYPNPAKNYFYIEINDEITENAIVTISDLSGKVLFNKGFKTNEIKTIETTAYNKSVIKIELADRITEMLIVKITTDSQVFSSKVVLLQKGK